MHGIEILVQNSKQILNVIVKTQPRVTDLKGPVNKGFNQSVTASGKAVKLFQI